MFEDLFKTQKTEEKQLEKDRYIQSQLDLIQTKLKRLEQVISVGMPLAEAEETIDRLDVMEKEIKTTASKNTMIASTIKELKENMDKINKNMEEKASVKQLSLFAKRIDFLEKLYGELSSSKTKDIFLNMVEIIQNLEARVKNLEEISHKNIGLLFEQELQKVKSTVGTGAGGEGSGIPGAPKAPKQPIGMRVNQFFSKLFKGK